MRAVAAAVRAWCVCAACCVCADLFTISVGNLPPGAVVLIKFCYVQELAMDGENIAFPLPSAVSDVGFSAASADVTQVTREHTHTHTERERERERHTHTHTHAQIRTRIRTNARTHTLKHARTR